MNAPAVVARREDGYIQDPASQLVAGLVDTKEGHRVLDLCAAPGGKTSALAGDVVAVELNEARIGLLRGNLVRLKSAASVVRADAVHSPFRTGSFDRVLLDAPCTGLGVLRRRPDARWRIQRRDVERLGTLQTEMLASAATLVAPGGRLVYSVCTLTDPETVDVVATLNDTFSAVELPEPWEPLRHGGRLVPDIGHDGMFAAVFERRG
jgi:16S rRNA (cytosine967-C5)-methyltransferase